MTAGYDPAEPGAHRPSAPAAPPPDETAADPARPGPHPPRMQPTGPLGPPSGQLPAVGSGPSTGQFPAPPPAGFGPGPGSPLLLWPRSRVMRGPLLCCGGGPGGWSG